MDIDSLFNVKDKIVLVTGGGRGVGEMIACGFVANGSRVYISSRDGDACAATAERLTTMGPGTCVAIPADLMEHDECIRLADEIKKREGVLHVLVNNSGVTYMAPLAEYSDKKFGKLLTLNVQRVFTLTRALLPLLEKGGKEDGTGRVINIGSVNGVGTPTFETYAYSASKAALHHLTRHLAGHVPGCVTVNALALGPFRSRMMQWALDNLGDIIVEGLPTQRIGSPEDVAGACLWLAGRAGEWVTGTVVPIDGGSLSAPYARL